MPTCDYCNKPAALVGGSVIYPHRPDLAHKWFWSCAPCKAYVGCHIDSPGQKRNLHKPLGRLANSELREAKKQAHAAFDPLWQSGRMARTSAYKWAAEAMQLPKEKMHIGMLDIEQCQRLTVAATAMTIEGAV